jgi:hypothetical protein
MSTSIVLLRHARTPVQDQLWKKCYASIREFHPDTPVIIISDNSTIPITDSLSNTTLIESEFPGAGELLPYYYFLKHHWTERIVFLHDSMLLIKPLNFAEIEKYPARFLWHFSDHQWDDDKVILPFLSELKNSETLVPMFRNKAAWDGCFGVASTITYNFLSQLNDKYDFFTQLTNRVRTRDHRMAMERAFAVAVFCEAPFPRNERSLCGCIHDMPFRWSTITEDKIATLKRIYPYSIIKTWHGR